jgi:hypothetical protein
MKEADRAFTRRAVMTMAGATADDFESLKRHQKMAAYRGGLEGLIATGWSTPGMPSTDDAEAMATAARAVPEDLWVGALQKQGAIALVLAAIRC